VLFRSKTLKNIKIKTHPDFKSVYSEITNAKIMDNYVGHALSYQSMFDRHTTPWEKTLWEDKELENFNIDLEKIDRLYYIYYAEEEMGRYGEKFRMTARMDYEGIKVYFELVANCDYMGFDGRIFVSGDADLFMEIIITDKYQINLIYQSLREDGIQVEELTEYDVCSHFQKHNAPMLRFLCHLTIYKNKNLLEASFSQLPKPLEKSVKSFTQTMEAKEDYDNWDD